MTRKINWIWRLNIVGLFSPVLSLFFMAVAWSSKDYQGMWAIAGILGCIFLSIAACCWIVVILWLNQLPREVREGSSTANQYMWIELCAIIAAFLICLAGLIAVATWFGSMLFPNEASQLANPALVLILVPLLPSAVAYANANSLREAVEKLRAA